jgi:nicotinate-nucleotide pyrophosphorylase (carboxylating)
MERPDATYVARLVGDALTEDGASHDATAAFLALPGGEVDAEIVLGERAVVCGVEVAREVFHQVDPALAFTAALADGDGGRAGAVVARLRGAASAVVAGERVALNFLQRLSGTATLASRFVAAVRGSGAVILDTRKTTPLLRDLEKYAVRCGGAQNHRRDLAAMVLVKENHVRALGGREALLRRLRGRRAGGFVEVEVDSLAFLDDLLGARVDRVMLDNFSAEEVREAVARLETHARTGGARPEVEVSGGITLDNVRDYAMRGVDFISVGALTHSAPAVAMSLEVRA